MSRGSKDYWDGYAAEQARQGQITYAELAVQVAKNLSRDNVHKQRILQRSPHLGQALDAAEYEEMSARELAARELKELGIKTDGRSTEEQLLDAHHAGREHERARVNGRRQGVGVKESVNAMAIDSTDSFMSKYLDE